MQLNKYFPKLCPPSCGLEIQYQRIKNNPKVKFFTLAEVTKVNGAPGAYEVTVRIRPRHAGPNSPDLSGLCGELNAEVPNDFDFGLSTRKAVYMDAPFAFPQRYVVDKTALSSADKAKVQKCGYFDLNEEEKAYCIQDKDDLHNRTTQRTVHVYSLPLHSSLYSIPCINHSRDIQHRNHR